MCEDEARDPEQIALGQVEAEEIHDLVCAALIYSSSRQHTRTSLVTVHLLQSKQEAQQVGRRVHDLELLVNARCAEPGSHVQRYVQTENWSTDLGHCYAARRQSRRLTLQEAAERLAISPQLLLAIESPGLSQKVTLHAYLQYADLLGCTFSSLVFEVAARSRIEESEGSILAQVDEVMIETLRQVYCTPAHGQPVIIPPAGTIARKVGLSYQRLRDFPQVEAVLIRIACKDPKGKNQSHLVSILDRLPTF